MSTYDADPVPTAICSQCRKNYVARDMTIKAVLELSPCCQRQMLLTLSERIVRVQYDKSEVRNAAR